MRILFASHTYPGGPFVVGSHHLARQLALQGHKILHVSTPLTPLHFLRSRSRGDTGGRLRLWSSRAATDPQFGRYVPFGMLPWTVAGPLFSLTGRNALIATLPPLRDVLRQCGMDGADLLVIDQPTFAGIERIVRPSVLLLRSTDLFEEYGGSHMRAAEIALARAADGLVGTSEPVLNRLTLTAPGKPALLLENGVDYDHFSQPVLPPPEYSGLERPIAVYAGALDERFDFPAIARLASEMPSLSIVLIGPLASPKSVELVASRNVHLLGPRSYDMLPQYLQHSDLGLLPLNDHPANAGRSPMKFYEYMASGLPVVARRTIELERRRAASAALYDGIADFIAKCRDALAARPDRDTIRAAAQQQGWEAKARALVAFGLQLASAKGAVGA